MGQAVSALSQKVKPNASASSVVPSPASKRTKELLDQENEQPWITAPSLQHLRSIVEQAGTRINLNSFEVKATIGKGNFGRVRMVRFKNSPDTTPFALKILHKMKIANEWGGSISHAARAVLRETTILQAVENPFIVNVLKVFHNEKKVFILMEFVNGGEMFRLIHKTNGLTLDLIQYFGAEIVITMRHLHDRFVCYRDLKPENVLLDCSGHIKLIDFGLAKILEKQNDFKTRTCCGTLCYQAPEVILNKEYSFQVDWWGVGAFIFEMMSGKAPFGNDNTFAIQQRILSTSILWPKSRDVALVRNKPLSSLISQFLTQKPEKRLGSADPMKIEKHPFFQTIYFESIRKRAVKPPYRPNLSSAEDFSMFPKYAESVEDSMPDLSKKDKQAWIHELNMPLCH
ncbi:unnamed protein product [Amoebophrya sp. A120]|nr:unnamed protein product [Amoebophrya sp. A120]|eukprot:GSA120T00020989001.1